MTCVVNSTHRFAETSAACVRQFPDSTCRTINFTVLNEMLADPARMFTTMLLFQRGYDFKYLFDLSSHYNRDRNRVLWGPARHR